MPLGFILEGADMWYVLCVLLAVCTGSVQSSDAGAGRSVSSSMSTGSDETGEVVVCSIPSCCCEEGRLRVMKQHPTVADMTDGYELLSQAAYGSTQCGHAFWVRGHFWKNYIEMRGLLPDLKEHDADHVARSMFEDIYNSARLNCFWGIVDLARCYELGVGVPSAERDGGSQEKCYRLYEKAYGMKHFVGTSYMDLVSLGLARCSERGWGSFDDSRKNQEKAFTFYQEFNRQTDPAPKFFEVLFHEIGRAHV